MQRKHRRSPARTPHPPVYVHCRYTHSASRAPTPVRATISRLHSLTHARRSFVLPVFKKLYDYCLAIDLHSKDPWRGLTHINTHTHNTHTHTPHTHTHTIGRTRIADTHTHTQTHTHKHIHTHTNTRHTHIHTLIVN